MSVGSNLAKSGWLYRQSSVLKKWKRCWFTLTTDGFFRYFDTELSIKAEDIMNIPYECVAIKVGSEVNVHKLNPPDGLRINFLMTLETTNGRKWTLCGDTEDEIKAWQLALQEAKQLLTRPVRSPSCPPPGVTVYQAAPVTTVIVDDTTRRYGYPYGYPYGGYSTRVVAYPAQPTMYYTTGYPTIIYDRYPYYRYRPSDFAFGMLAGTAVGSLMFAPLLFWC